MSTLARQSQRRTAVPAPAYQREWYPTAKAAGMLGISERSLRRRLDRPGWLEGQHYRWVTGVSRRVLEVNVPRVLRLLEQRGWS